MEADVLKDISKKNKKLKNIRQKLGRALTRTDKTGRIDPDDLPTQRDLLSFMSNVPLEISTLRTILRDAEKALNALTDAYINTVTYKINETPKTQTGLLSEQAAANALGIHKETLARQRRARTGPAFTQVGKRILYSHEALQEYIKKHTS